MREIKRLFETLLLSDISYYIFNWAEVKIEGMYGGISGMQLYLQLGPLYVIYRAWGLFLGVGDLRGFSYSRYSCNYFKI